MIKKIKKRKKKGREIEELFQSSYYFFFPPHNKHLLFSLLKNLNNNNIFDTQFLVQENAFVVRLSCLLHVTIHQHEFNLSML